MPNKIRPRDFYEGVLRGYGTSEQYGAVVMFMIDKLERKSESYIRCRDLYDQSQLQHMVYEQFLCIFADIKCCSVYIPHENAKLPFMDLYVCWKGFHLPRLLHWQDLAQDATLKGYTLNKSATGET